MAENPALTLAQWFSPGFPVGAFAYSHGLEWVIEQGELSTAADLETWVEALLVHGTGRNDCIFLVSAHVATHPEELDLLNELCLSYCVAKGRRIETTEQGAAFARTLRLMYDDDLADYAYPIAVGRAAKLHTLPIDMTLRFYLQAFAAALVSAAVRRVPLGQTEGQRVLARLQPCIEEVARGAIHLDTSDLHATTFHGDIAAMEQDGLYARVFRS